jgi:hypothetical protein
LQRPAEGYDAAHPVYVRQLLETPAPGSVATPEPMLVATQQTANYTHELTLATFLLFFGIIIALIIGELQRRAGLKDAEKARREQYEQDKKLSEATIADLKEERANQARLREEEAERRRVAGLAQLVASGAELSYYRTRADDGKSLVGRVERQCRVGYPCESSKHDP